MFSPQIRLICLSRPSGSPPPVALSSFPFLSKPYFSVTTSLPSCLSHMTSHTTMTIPPTSSMTSIVHACDNFTISPDLTPVTTPRAALLCSLRPPPEPPPCSSPSILRFVSAPCPPSLSSLVRPPRKPPDKFRIDLKAVLLQGLCFYCPLSKPPWVFLGHLISVLSLCLLLLFLYVIDVVLCIVVCILFLCLIGFKLLRDWSLDSRCHTSSVGLYEDGSSFTALCLHQLIFVQRDKVKKSETMCSRNVRDEAKEMIRNWIGKKTLGSHLSFVSFRRWKMLNELIGYEIWIKFSCLSPMLMCTANPVVIVFFPCIGTSKLLGNTPSMITLAACNPLCFMKC